MAISPPSDLLLDVARAADPGKVREATARLARLAADPAAVNDDFGKALAAASAVKVAPTAGLDAKAVAPPTSTGAASLRTKTEASGETYRKFEAVMLQNFVESILPKDDASFGDAASAGIYRSMMAEQLANQISKAGGIGIAAAIAKAHPAAQSVPATTSPA